MVHVEECIQKVPGNHINEVWMSKKKYVKKHMLKTHEKHIEIQNKLHRVLTRIYIKPISFGALFLMILVVLVVFTSCL